jgi:hypothetical protein
MPKAPVDDTFMADRRDALRQNYNSNNGNSNGSGNRSNSRSRGAAQPQERRRNYRKERRYGRTDARGQR